ncbi:MAG: anhydro-N-acetylmuramic acid kinase [Xanthomonadales bacterium]|nr:anhydro-N-acetylmuramic acid kinase [Xanthomonadales bacterium]
MSGTSADAIDAALVEFASGAPRLVAAHGHPWPARVRRRLLAVATGDGAVHLDDLGTLDGEVAECFADAALALMRVAGITAAAVAAIGSHGQTIWHRPGAHPPFTLQLGDPSRIAERTGCTVVADFRRRDLAAGGQGAPLMSAFHAVVLGRAGQDVAVLNLGGIANLTLLPAGGTPVLGFDTGPASCLLDDWARRHTGQPYDRDGALASRGRVDRELLARLLAEPWFALPAPKSTGREVFNPAWLDARLPARAAPEDVQATLVALTAQTVAEALRRHAPDTTTVIACGGGVHNPVLMAALARAVAPARLLDSGASGIDPDYVEAIGFAWLARRTLDGLPGNLPSVTGARGPRILGGIYPA